MKDASDLQRLAPGPHPRPLSKGEGRLTPNIVSPPRNAPPPRHSDRSARGTSARSGGTSRHFCHIAATRVWW
ncbi:MAG: hypothetical protein LBB79_07690 [Prevotellaceae bacterium]|nr:hypothetical protein [Prevotellaceae bacterium]